MSGASVVELAGRPMEVWVDAPVDTSFLRTRLAHEVDVALGRWEATASDWGDGDCGLSIGDIILAATGKDPMLGMRGHYKTRRGCLRAMRRQGFRSVEDMLAAVAGRLGWRPILPAAGEPGDIGLVPGRGGPAFVIRGAYFWYGRKSFGVSALPTNVVTLAYAVV